MNSIKYWMAAQHPSCFGMPISGSASRVTVATADVRTATTVVRERIAAAMGAVVKSDQGLALSAATAYFPGTDAWRPPTC